MIEEPTKATELRLAQGRNNIKFASLMFKLKR